MQSTSSDESASLSVSFKTPMGEASETSIAGVLTERERRTIYRGTSVGPGGCY